MHLKLKKTVVNLMQQHKENLKNSAGQSSTLVDRGKIRLYTKHLSFLGKFNQDITASVEKILFDSLTIVLKKKKSKKPVGMNFSMVKRLLFETWELPIPMINSLITIAIDYDFDLKKMDDKLLFAKIVADRIAAVETHKNLDKLRELRSKIVWQYVDQLKGMVMKRELANNVRILLERYAPAYKRENKDNSTDDCKDNENWIDIFEQEAKNFAIKFVEFESKSKESHKLLMDSKSQWECYYCNGMNNNETNECLKCNKGVNPLWLARNSKSATFCVNKPFGLIKWKDNVCFF